jgi:hypothetical protein
VVVEDLLVKLTKMFPKPKLQSFFPNKKCDLMFCRIEAWYCLVGITIANYF